MTEDALHIVSPAPMEEALRLYGENAPMKPIEARAAILQLARSESQAFYNVAGTLVAVALFYPLPQERPGEILRELAFVCKYDLARYLVGFIHLARLTRARLAQNGPVRVRAHVRIGHLPGRRLAALCGMAPVGTVGHFERFEFEGRPDVEICGRDQFAVQRAGYVGTAG